MNAEETERFEFLRLGPCVPSKYIRQLFGLEWPFADELLHDFEVWKKSRVNGRARCADANVNRYEVELFFTQRRLLPRKWMAAKLGMHDGSLELIMGRLEDLGLRRQRYNPYPQIVAEELEDDLEAAFPEFRFVSFGDHNSFCTRLHGALERRLDIKIQGLYCATSETLKEEPRWFATTFDNLTLLPLSVKHQVWLDFKKPLSLAPDRCSKLIYAENHEALEPYRAGTSEPPDLDAYHEFLSTAR
jgi:hypothetical protein